jgi:DNA replication protein DnaC
MQQTLQTLRRMKLHGMAEAFERQLSQAASHDEMSFEERFSLIIDYEQTWRENRRLERLLKKARLKQQACVEDIDYSHKRGLEKRQMVQLASCEWIRQHRNVCITGSTGTGKTWISCALGNAACRQGLSVFYIRVSRLFEELKIAHGDGSFPRRMAQLAKVDLLIMDDWGLAPLARAERHDLLEIMEDRHGSRSTIITSQLPVENWHEYINDPTIADAVLDRVVHNAHKIALKGESMRKTKGRSDWIGSHQSGRAHHAAKSR